MTPPSPSPAAPYARIRCPCSELGLQPPGSDLSARPREASPPASPRPRSCAPCAAAPRRPHPPDRVLRELLHHAIPRRREHLVFCDIAGLEQLLPLRAPLLLKLLY